MITKDYGTWAAARYGFARDLAVAPPTVVGEWQSQKSVEGANTTYEVMNATFSMEIPATGQGAAQVVGPNLPWAEDHFQERVSGKPLNPPPSNAWWPFNVASNALHKVQEKFSHTYPERYWPRFAGSEDPFGPGHQGIRYGYGDLGSVVDLLARSPYTRQAYLPVWFPEDTGSVSGQRVPCSLGYQFLIRNSAGRMRLNVMYQMRSCDFLRHLPDDIYMTIRLVQWVRDRLQDADPAGFTHLRTGRLFFQAGSLHVFEPDRQAIRKIVVENDEAYARRLNQVLGGSLS